MLHRTLTEQQHDQDLLDAAGFDSTVHDIDRWVQTAACPGEIFKLTIIDPSADKMFELREGWKWERDGDHIEVQGLQPVDSVEHHDFSLFDICYVETKNQYVAWDPPIGILRIYVNGGTTVLKTIIVDYGIVARYALSAIVHEQANVTPNMIQGWLDEATNNTFLKDSLPWGGSIKQRYDDDEDVHCPIALVLENPDEPLATFNGTDVHRDGHAQEYNVLSPNDPQKIQNLLTTPWFNNVAYGFDLIVVTNLGGSVGNGTRDGWDNGDALWDENDGHIWVQTDNNLNNPDHAVAHEWGHYKGDLPDLYFCSNCGQNPCTCGLKRWRDPPNHPDNLMTMGVDVGVLAGDKTALTR